jgi:hemoglobin
MKMEELIVKKVFSVLMILVFSGMAWSQMAQPESLYKRLGGYDALAAVTDDFIGRLASDPALKKFFVGHSTDSLHRIRQLIVDQLCAATGGPCVYTGRDMKTAHKGLGISESDWDLSVKHLVATLEKFKVPQKEKDEVLGAISAMKADIVEKM